MHRTLLTLAIGFVLLASTLAADDKADDGFKPLFNGKDFNGWKFVLSKKDADPDKTWSIENGIIVCTGKPHGYFHTEKTYKNYALRYDWKYARPKGLTDEEKFDGNSGALIHIQKPHKVWPKCVEVQGMNREHGNTFGVSGAKGKFKFDKQALLSVRKPVGEWNMTEIICDGGNITVKVNDKQVSTGKGELEEGLIGFRSEGAKIYFRNIKIKEMK
jgi:hypothetical protein